MRSLEADGPDLRALRIEQVTHRRADNYALVQKSGPKTHRTPDYVIAKEFTSHADFQHKLLDAAEGGRKDPVHDPLGTNQALVSELTGGAVFTIDGITFGLEVCRDHLQRRLAHGQESGKVLIQLIPPAGMSILTCPWSQRSGRWSPRERPTRRVPAHRAAPARIA